MIADLRNRLREKYGSTPEAATPVALEAAATDTPPQSTLERAFVMTAESGRTIITAPLREVASDHPGFTMLRGRFVEADIPNDNGALWTSDDLQLGGATVVGGPLNWLHQERKIIGTLTAAELVEGREAAAQGLGNHIVSDAVMWNFLYPNEATAVERASASGDLYFSMECLSREVACIDAPGRPGCGESFAYADYDAGRTCMHLRQRSSLRRFVDPTFYGGAVIVPPVRPGWSKANAEVVRQAAEEAERASLDELTGEQATAMVAQILEWANRS